MPRFTHSNSFVSSFISYVVLNQVTLYVFIAVIVGAMALVFHHISMSIYINLLLVLILFCLVNLSIMFLMWAAKQNHSKKVLGLMVIGLVLLLVFALLLKENGSIKLAFSMIFIFVCPFIIALFGYSINKYSKLKL